MKNVELTYASVLQRWSKNLTARIGMGNIAYAKVLSATALAVSPREPEKNLLCVLSNRTSQSQGG